MATRPRDSVYDVDQLLQASPKQRVAAAALLAPPSPAPAKLQPPQLPHVVCTPKKRLMRTPVRLPGKRMVIQSVQVQPSSFSSDEDEAVQTRGQARLQQGVHVAEAVELAPLPPIQPVEAMEVADSTAAVETPKDVKQQQQPQPSNREDECMPLPPTEPASHKTATQGALAPTVRFHHSSSSGSPASPRSLNNATTLSKEQDVASRVKSSRSLGHKVPGLLRLASRAKKHSSGQQQEPPAALDISGPILPVPTPLLSASDCETTEGGSDSGDGASQHDSKEEERKKKARKFNKSWAKLKTAAKLQGGFARARKHVRDEWIAEVSLMTRNSILVTQDANQCAAHLLEKHPGDRQKVFFELQRLNVALEWLIAQKDIVQVLQSMNAEDEDGPRKTYTADSITDSDGSTSSSGDEDIVISGPIHNTQSSSGVLGNLSRGGSKGELVENSPHSRHGSSAAPEFAASLDTTRVVNDDDEDGDAEDEGGEEMSHRFAATGVQESNVSKEAPENKSKANGVRFSGVHTRRASEGGRVDFDGDGTLALPQWTGLKKRTKVSNSGFSSEDSRLPSSNPTFRRARCSSPPREPQPKSKPAFLRSMTVSALKPDRAGSSQASSPLNIPSFDSGSNPSPARPTSAPRRARVATGGSLSLKCLGTLDNVQGVHRSREDRVRELQSVVAKPSVLNSRRALRAAARTYAQRRRRREAKSRATLYSLELALQYNPKLSRRNQLVTKKIKLAEERRLQETWHVLMTPPVDSKKRVDIMLEIERRRRQKLPAILQPRRIEMRCYARLTGLLMVLEKSASHPGMGYRGLSRSVRAMHATLLQLRECEHAPSKRSQSGFFNKIDNLLALLLFRPLDYDPFSVQAAQDEAFFHKELSQESGQSDSDTLDHSLTSGKDTLNRGQYRQEHAKLLTYISRLTERAMHRARRVPVLAVFLGLVLLAQVVIGVTVLWYVGKSYGDDLLAEQLGILGKQLRIRASGELDNFLKGAEASLSGASAVVRLGDPLGSASRSEHLHRWLGLDSRLVAIVESTRGVSSAFMISPSGDMVGAFRLQGGEVVIDARETLTSQPFLAGGNCTYRYRMDRTLLTRDTSTRTIVSCGYSPSLEPWWSPFIAGNAGPYDPAQANVANCTDGGGLVPMYRYPHAFGPTGEQPQPSVGSTLLCAEYDSSGEFLGVLGADVSAADASVAMRGLDLPYPGMLTVPLSLGGNTSIFAASDDNFLPYLYTDSAQYDPASGRNAWDLPPASSSGAAAQAAAVDFDDYNVGPLSRGSYIVLETALSAASAGSQEAGTSTLEVDGTRTAVSWSENLVVGGVVTAFSLDGTRAELRKEDSIMLSLGLLCLLAVLVINFTAYHLLPLREEMTRAFQDALDADKVQSGGQGTGSVGHIAGPKMRHSHSKRLSRRMPLSTISRTSVSPATGSVGTPPYGGVAKLNLGGNSSTGSLGSRTKTLLAGGGAGSAGVKPSKLQRKRHALASAIRNRPLLQITISMAAMVVLGALIISAWLTYNTLTGTTLEGVTDLVLQQTRSRIDERVRAFLSLPDAFPQAARSLLLESTRLVNGQVVLEQPPGPGLFPGLRGNSSNATTGFFVEQMTGVVEQSPDVDGVYPVDGFYVGFEDTGEFYGAALAGSDVVSLIRSGETCNCLEQRTDPLVDTGNPCNRLITTCSYDPRKRPWYIKANQTGTNVWSDTYQYISISSVSTEDSVQIGLTSALPFYAPGPTNDTVGRLLGVVGADVTITALSVFLATLDVTGLDSTRAMIVEQQTGALVASSEPADSAILAVDSKSQILASSASFLQQMPGGLQAITGAMTITRSRDDPLTVVSKTLAKQKPGETPAEWITVLTAPRIELLGATDQKRNLMFLFTIGVVMLVAFSVNYMMGMLQRDSKVVKRKQEREFAMSILGMEKTTKEALEDHAHKINPVIIDANGRTWRRRQADATNRWREVGVNSDQLPLSWRRLHAHSRKRAVDHFKSAARGRNILTECDLDSLQSQWPLRLYDIISTTWYKMALDAIIIGHMLLVFQEPSTLADLQETGSELWIIILEAFILCVEVFHVIVTMLVTHKWTRHNVLHSSSQYTHDTVLATAIFLVALDWLFGWSLRWSFEFVLPIRPLIYILVNVPVRQAAVTLLKTVWIAKDVFVLYMCILLLAMLMGLMLFRVGLSGVDGAFDANSNHQDFWHSFVTSFVYLSTGENYTELVYAAFEENKLFVLYFVAFTIMGMFFVLAMVIGLFQDGFSQMQQRGLAEQLLVQRTGAVAAFGLLDLDERKMLSLHEFLRFMRRVIGVDRDVPLRKWAMEESELYAKLQPRSRVAAWHWKRRTHLHAERLLRAPMLQPVRSIHDLALCRQNLNSATTRVRQLHQLDVEIKSPAEGRFRSLRRANTGLQDYSLARSRGYTIARLAAASSKGSGVSINSPGSVAVAPMHSSGFQPVGSSSFMLPGVGETDSNIGSPLQHDGDEVAADELMSPEELDLSLEMDLFLFVQYVEAMLVRSKQDGSLSRGGGGPIKSDWRMWLRFLVVETMWFNSLALFLTMVLAWILLLYGIVPESTADTSLDTACFSILLFFWVEMVLRLLAYGLSGYWHSRKRLQRTKERQFANRFDLVVIGISLVLYMALKIADTYTAGAASGVGFNELTNSKRFVFTVPVVRLLSLIPSSLHLIFTLTKIIPAFLSLFTLLLVIFYVYGAYGVLLFSGKLETVLQDNAPDGSFDRMGTAVLTLFQLLVGEGWHDIMFAAVRASEWSSTWYFVSFIIIVTLLFSNLFVGVILAIFGSVVHRRNISSKDVLKAILVRSQRQQMYRNQ